MYRLANTACCDGTERKFTDVLLSVEPGDHHFIVGSPSHHCEIVVPVINLLGQKNSFLKSQFVTDVLTISAGLVSGKEVRVPVFMPDTAVSDTFGLVRPAYT